MALEKKVPGFAQGGATGVAGGLLKGGLAGAMVSGINAAVDLLGKLTGILEKASPALAGTFAILQRSFMIFFRPFGDFLSILLRPMAILLMRMAINFMEWMKKPLDFLINGEGTFDIGQWVTDSLKLAGEAAFDLAGWILEKATEIVFGTIDLGIWALQNLDKIVVGAFNFFEWLDSKFDELVSQELFMFGEWIGDKVGEFIDTASKWSPGEWLANSIPQWIQVTETFDLGKFLLDKVTEFFTGGARGAADKLSGLSVPGTPISAGGIADFASGAASGINNYLTKTSEAEEISTQFINNSLIPVQTQFDALNVKVGQDYPEASLLFSDASSNSIKQMLSEKGSVDALASAYLKLASAKAKARSGNTSTINNKSNSYGTAR